MLGTTEWLIIFCCVVLLLVPIGFPGLARSIGESITNLKEGMKTKPDSNLTDSSQSTKEAEKL